MSGAPRKMIDLICPVCGAPMKSRLRANGEICRLMCTGCWKLVPARLRSANRRRVLSVQACDHGDHLGLERTLGQLSRNARLCVSFARTARLEGRSVPIEVKGELEKIVKRHANSTICS